MVRHPLTALGASALLLVGAGAAHGAPGVFTRHSLVVSHPVREDVHAVLVGPDGERGLVVAGVAEDGRSLMSVYPVDSRGGFAREPRRIIPLADEVLALDSDGESLYALTPAGVQRWTPGTTSFVPVLEGRSIFQLRPPTRLIPVSFLDDVDGDRDADVILPDFAGYRVFTQDDAGAFRPTALLEIPVIAHHQEYNHRITYRPVSVYFLDVTGDDVRDAVAVRGGSLLFFAGEGGGRFGAGKTSTLGLGITERFLGDDVGGADIDHTDQMWKRVIGVADFDEDGAVDLFTHTVESEGLFDKTHALELSRGTGDGRFTFDEERSRRIETNVIIDTPTFADINGDGRLDFGMWSVDFGIGTVFGWLVSGTVDLEVSYFALREDGSYGPDPDRREEVEVAFDLASGKPSVPPWFLGDVDGDGTLDLILGEGEERIRVFLGNRSGRLFADTPVETEVRLPGNGRDLVSPLDVNADGRTDVVIRYGAVDGKDVAGTLEVLIAQP